MVDPVAWVTLATALTGLVVFGVLERPALQRRLGDGFVGRARAKALGGVGFLAVTGVTVYALELRVASAGFALTDLPSAIQWTLACLVTMAPVAAWSSTRPPTWTRVPELRADDYTAARVAALVGAWSLYLLGYEAFFRGVLTHVLAHELGLVRGLAIMTALYGLAHLTKRSGEAFATLVVGPIYGWIALRTGGFWPVFVVHVVVACSAELVAAWKNPAIRFLGHGGRP